MSSSPALISQLPDDILLGILRYLCVGDVVAVRRTCKLLREVTDAKQLWLHILQRDVLSKGLPSIAHRISMDALSAASTERIVTHSLSLKRTLRPSSEIRSPSHIMLPQTRSVTWVQVVGGTYLISACSDASTSILSLWRLSSLMGSGPYPARALLDEAYLEGPVEAGLVDLLEGTPIIALELRPEGSVIVEVLSLRLNDERPVFTRVARFVDDISHIRMLSGYMLGFGVHRDRSLPSLLNWKTGDVFNLVGAPDVKGGTVAMALHGELAIVVTPQEIQSYSVVRHGDDLIHVQLLRIYELDHPVGFAQCVFRSCSPSDTSPTLFASICGSDGIFVYTSSIDRLRALEGADDLTLSWALPGGTKQGRVSPRRDDDLYLPSFGKYCPTLSWLIGPFQPGKHIAFATLPALLTDSDPSENDISVLPEFRLEHPDLPALYAQGVYDYDEGLGLAVFGNAFGELAVFNLSGIDLDTAENSFGIINSLASVTVDDELLSQTATPSACAPPFPLAGPFVPSNEYKEAVLALWRARQPTPVPDGWELEGISTWPEQRGLVLQDDWVKFVPRIPRQGDDLAWWLEHENHYYGTIIPLVQNHWVIIFTAGGLLFVRFHEDLSLGVVNPGVSLDDLLHMYRDEGDPGGPLTFVEEEWTVREVIGRYWDMWNWERATTGRNRWQELKDRGGEVHADRTDDLPEPKSFW